MWLIDFVQNNILWVIEFIIMFSFLIIVHELGHFWAARKSGVKVLEFGVGFGKRLYTKKVGETEYCLNLIPFGGYVKMLGEEESSNAKGSFEKAALWKRMIITLGGVFMNFLSAIIILTFLFTHGTDPIIITETDKENAYNEGYFGMKEGNVIYVAPGVMKDELDFKKGDGEITTATASWDELSQKTGLQGGFLREVKMPMTEAFFFSFTETGRISKAILQKVAEIPASIMDKHRLPEGMAGPLGIAEVTKKLSEMGIMYLVKMAALLSISLGVMNLLPIPALDGGRFFFQLVELCLKPFKVKINEKIENYAYLAGYFVLFGFLIAVTIEDIFRIFFKA